MGFWISFKYSLITIVRSKQFIITNLVIFFIMVSLNLSWNSYIVVTQNEAKALWSINAINTVLIFVLTSIVSIMFAYEFIHLQKKNGVKLLELKSGLKPWQMFFSKITAVTIVNLTIVLSFSTIIVLINLIFFNSNLTVVKLITINLYSLVFITLLILSYALLANALNWNKLALIALGLITGIFCLYPLLNSAIYEFTLKYDYTGKGGGNEVDHNNKDINLSYQSKRVANLVGNSELIELLGNFRDDCILKKTILKIKDPKKKLDNPELEWLKDYYEGIVDAKQKELVFLNSGQLLDVVDTFNKANKEILKEEYFFEIELNKNKCLNMEMGDFLKEADIPKGDLNIFGNGYSGAKTISLIREMKSYIKSLETEIKEHKEYSFYYKDWKEINRIVLDYYNKYFYFASHGSTQFDVVEARLFSITEKGETQEENEEPKKYFVKDQYKELNNIGREKERADFLYNLRDYSSGRIMYQKIFFKIFAPFDPKAELASTIDQRMIENSHLFHYYTSPIIWLEYLSMYGFNSHSYENLASIQTYYFFQPNNLIEIKYDAPKTGDKTFKINEFKYRGPNRWLMFFMILIFPIILIAIAFLIYKRNLFN